MKENVIFTATKFFVPKILYYLASDVGADTTRVNLNVTNY